MVTALHNYDLGKYIASKSEAIKKRGDNDKLGDLAFTLALEMVSPVSGGSLKQFTDDEGCEKLCAWISKVVAKLHEAFVWSPARLEEQSDTLRQMGKLLVQMCLQVDFALSDDLVHSCYNEFQVIVKGWPVDLAQQEAVDKYALVATTENLIIDIMQRRDSSLPKLEAAIEVAKKFYTNTMLPKFKTIGKDLGDEFQVYAEKFNMVTKRQAMWRSLLSGVIDFAELMACPAQSFEDALPAWTEHKRLCSATSGAASSPQDAPYLNYVLSFASARRLIIECGDTSYASRPMRSGSTSYEFVAKFLNDSSVAKFVYEFHCSSKVHEGLASFCASVNPRALNSVDLESWKGDLAVADMMPLLVNGDLNDMATLVTKHSNFSNRAAPSIGQLPHLVTARLVSTIIGKMMEGQRFCPELQLESATKPLSQDVLSNLLTLWSNVTTLRLHTCASMWVSGFESVDMRWGACVTLFDIVCLVIVLLFRFAIDRALLNQISKKE